MVISADEALRAPDSSGDHKASSDAEDFLRDKLSQGPVSAREGEDLEPSKGRTAAGVSATHPRCPTMLFVIVRLLEFCSPEACRSFR